MSQFGPLARVAAFVAGIVVLLCGAVVSLGGVLLAPVVMAIAGYVQRRRGDPLTRGGHWIAACSSMVVLIVILAGAFLSITPKGTLRSVMNAADSSSAVAAKEPPPAWLQRMSQGYRVRQTNMQPPSRVVMVLTTIFGIGFALSFFAALFGSLGWGAGMLLGVAVQGRWPGYRENSSDDLAGLAHTPTS